MAFKPGQSGNPKGRKKGSKNHRGLSAVLSMLENLVSEEKNLNKLKKDFQEAFDRNPKKFYYKFIMPLLPKNIKHDFNEDTPIQIVINAHKNE